VFREIMLKRIHDRSLLISIIFISIPLILSTFTHLWNPIGFPGIHLDEGTYMRRALHMIFYLDPQGSQGGGAYYDHPYFGQIFLAGILSLLGYPDSLQPSTDVKSIEMLLMVPRVLMGLLAVVDTFLVYKIADRRYNNRMIGFIAAIIFAVMPVTWLYSRILLDNILVPFLLTSILCAIYLRKYDNPADRNSDYAIHEKKFDGNGLKTGNDSNDTTRNKEITTSGPINAAAHGTAILSRRNVVIITLSGALLGLTIFTKVPAISMIPIVGFLVFANTNRSFKALGLWFIPVILIPMIWPAYAILQDDFNPWLNTILRQASRESAGVIGSITEITRIDPIFYTIALMGCIYAAVKRDTMLLLWIIPFIVFFTFVAHYINWFHWIPVIPAFSIAAAVMIVDVSSKVTKKGMIQNVLPLALISAVGIFGLVSTVMLITTNLSFFQFQTAAFVANHLKANDNSESNLDKTTVISSQIYSWIFKYVFREDNIFATYRERLPIETGKVILVVDNNFKSYMNQEEPAERDRERVQRLQTLYNTSNVLNSFEGKTQEYDRNSYPYYSMKYNFGGTRVQIREAVGYSDQLQSK
jgi:4-amino-4-deoxy-L-arabinose transferase-like glycosyltransferase